MLDKEDVSLEAILDEDDLLQECKAQNTRLIDYFQRVNVLQRLFGYVTGQIEGEERGRFKCVIHRLFPFLVRFSSQLGQISLRGDGSAVQRNMVHRRDVRERATAGSRALLGDRAGPLSGRYENPDGHGLSFCKDQLCVFEQKADRGTFFPAPTASHG